MAVAVCAAPAAQAAPVTPDPVGGAVGAVELRLADDRPDPWRPGVARSITVTVTYPAAPADGLRAPYLGVPSAGVTRHAIANAPVDRGAGDLPLVVFSPGYMMPRSTYSALTEDLASRGYAVVSVDHTGDALLTAEPDGGVTGLALQDSYSDAGLKAAIDARSADIRFVVDEAEAIAAGIRTADADGRPLPDGLADALDPARAGVVGHSMGGVAATEVLLDDPRIDAAVNLDGAMLYGNGPARITTADPGRPLLSIVSSEHAASREGRERFWNAYLSTPRTAWHREYAISGTGHFGFSDAQAVVPQWVPDIPGMSGPGSFNLGPAPRAEVIAATRDLLAAVSDRFLRGLPDAVLDDPGATHPLVVPMN